MRVQNICQLSDVEDKIVSATVVMHTDVLKTNFDEIEQLIKSDKGNINLKLSLFGMMPDGEHAGCDFYMKNRKVGLDVVKKLDTIEGCKVTVLK